MNPSLQKDNYKSAAIILGCRINLGRFCDQKGSYFNFLQKSSVSEICIK